MAKLSAAMAKQAQYVAQLHVWARREHPTYEDIVGLERLYAENPSARDQILRCTRSISRGRRRC